MPSVLRAPLVAAGALFLGMAGQALAQAPDLTTDKGPGDSLTIGFSPSLPGDPLVWHVYRGVLGDVGSWQQEGAPDGRCAIAGSERSVVLADELLLSGAHYYLLTDVQVDGVESTLGETSQAVERANNNPCPAVDGCGTEEIPVASVTRTEGIAIAPDGTLYYSQSQAVGIRPVGMAPDDAWVAVPGANTVWGLAYRDDGLLFVASPSAGGAIYGIDTLQPAPTAVQILAGAGGANGLIIGPDNAVYYSDFSNGGVWRVDDFGFRTEVTTSPITQPNGLLFDDDGTLLVLAYGVGQVWRLQLDPAMVETARVLVGTAPGSALDGIAKDVNGRFYLSDNGGGRLLRYANDFTNEEVLLTGLPSAANIAFGKADLDCTDVYVASSGSLGLYQADVTGRP